MTCNIIVTHRGNPPHLKYVLAQLKESNPNANIILMGDKSNNKYKFITHAYLDDYFDGAKKFADDYIHMNGTNIDYELFCYQRWFAVYEYMQKHDLEDVFSLDSDVLVYDDLSQLHSLISKYSFAVSSKDLTETNPGWWIAGPPIGYFHRDALKELINFFVNSYHDKKYLNLFDIKMQHHKQRDEPYGVCDMTQIFLFTRENADKFFNLSKPFKLNNELTYIDETILDIAGCVAENGHKKIEFINGIAYGFNASDGQKLRFPLIHFQGYTPVNAKEWIPSFYHGRICALNKIKDTFLSKKYWKIRKQIYGDKK